MTNDDLMLCHGCHDFCVLKDITYLDGMAYCPACIKIETSSKPTTKETMENFGTGATRTPEDDKLDYVTALSPIVLRRYLQYLAAHRTMSDGSKRDFDNWKQGIPERRYLKGLGRHLMALWLALDGFDWQDDPGQKDVEDVLCAIMFNSMGMLHERLKENGK